MSGRVILPIAPRPIDDELLSSWQGRVACRYGLSGEELAVLIGAGPDTGRVARFADRDFAPSAEAIVAWARACRVDKGSLSALVLSNRPRPLGWLLWAEATQARSFQRPICPACLDEDAEAGGDHHLRSDWALVERVTCGRHGCALVDACPHCLASLGWRFKVCSEAACLVCAHCDRVIRARIAPKAVVPSRFPQAMEVLSMRFRDAIDTCPTEADRMMRVARLLWALPKTRGGSRAPVITKLVDTRLSLSVGAQVDRDTPLATLPLGWRMMTLVAIAQLLDLGGARREFGPPPVSLKRLVEWTGRSTPARAPPTSQPPSDRIVTRSVTEYRAMAETILASDEWRNVQDRGAGARERVLGRLMSQALDRAPPVPGAAPDPAATSQKRRPIAGHRAACARASAPAGLRSRAG